MASPFINGDFEDVDGLQIGSGDANKMRHWSVDKLPIIL